MFRERYPEITKKKIPTAFDNFADPDKFFFFLRKENISLLRNDKEIWRLRQQTKILFYLSFVLPSAIVIIALLIGFLLTITNTK
jgi:hypothetical protein